MAPAQEQSTATVQGLTPGTWTVDPSHSEVGFVVRHLMVSKVKGRFGGVSGTINVAPDVLQSSVQASVDVTSIDTRDERRDAHLRSADFFEAEKFPTMTFTSTGIRQSGDSYLLDGDLTIKGVTKSVTFDLELNGVGPTPAQGLVAGFSAETEISRKDFGLEWNVALETGGVMVADKVTILLEIEATKAD